MIDFCRALLQYEFLQHALLVGLLASVACGVIGSYVVTRRITYIAGSISHCVLGGIGAARYLQVVWQWEWLHPLYGAIVASIVASLLIGWVSLNAQQREDTVIGAVWAIGMAMGILFITATPGYNVDLMNYLFGNILLVSETDLWLLLILDVVIVGSGILFYKPLLAICFDDEFARVRGLPVGFYYLFLLTLVGLTVVLLSLVVGVVMVIALITLPAAIASHFSTRLWHMMLLGSVVCAVINLCGLAFSYGPNLPTGALTIVIAGSFYLGVVVWKRVKG